MRAPPPTCRRLAADERGIALVIALLAIIVIGALVIGTFFAGRMEMQSGRNALYTGQATEMAEMGLTDGFATWNPVWNKFGVGGDSVRPTVYPLSASAGDNSLRYTRIVRFMRGGVFLVTARGEKLDRSGNILATRLLARVGKLVTPWVDMEAAVTSKGNVTVSGTSDIDGNNNQPSGWGDCTAGANEGGIRTNGVVIQQGTPSITGSPPTTEHDRTVVDSLFVQPYNSMLPYKTVTIPAGANWNQIGPSTTGSPAVCNGGDDHNWGEPGRAGFSLAGSAPLTAECQDFFPVVWASGNLRLQTGRGQGVLLVAGDLDIAGNFEFDGVVIVLGEIVTEGTGNKITGGVMANNAQIGDLTTFAGNPTVLYSQCAIAKALRGTAKGYPLTERSWVQINTR
jgi:hypothetical protein